MKHKRCPGAEDLPTDGAERPFDSALMLPHIMRPHISLPFKRSIAKGAGKLPFFTVDTSSMLLPAVVASKRLAADITLIDFAGQALMDISAVIHVFFPGNELLVTLITCYYIGRFLIHPIFIYLLHFKVFV